MAHKKFISEFKAKVAIEALKGHKTTNELASEFEVKKLLLEGSKLLFRGKNEKDVKSLEKNERGFTHK